MITIKPKHNKLPRHYKWIDTFSRFFLVKSTSQTIHVVGKIQFSQVVNQGIFGIQTYIVQEYYVKPRGDSLFLIDVWWFDEMLASGGIIEI